MLAFLPWPAREEGGNGRKAEAQGLHEVYLRSYGFRVYKFEVQKMGVTCGSMGSSLALYRGFLRMGILQGV